jgi:two-component sensor histidine kinase
VLENKLKFRKNREVISEVDSLLQQKNVTERQRSILLSYKVEALSDSEKFDEAKKLANETLGMGELPDHFKVRLWIKQSLLHEIIEDFKTSFYYLDKVDDYYSTHLKDEYFGVSLYRRASVNRLAGNKKVAVNLADSARRFGQKNNYSDVVATSYLLLGFLLKSTDYNGRLATFIKAKESFALSHDEEGVTATLLLIAKLYEEKGNNATAKKTLFEALENQKKPDTDSLLFGQIYSRLAKLYESDAILDSALYFTRSANRISEATALANLRITIKQLETEQEQMRRRYDVERAKADLDQSKTEKLFLAILLSITTVILFVLGYLLYDLKRKNIEIKKQRQLIEENNKELKISLTEKNILLKELNHRVKNNLSLILSLTSFHLEGIEDSTVREKMQGLESRIRAIAMTHEYFTYSQAEHNFSSINLSTYIEQIITSMIAASNRTIEYSLQIEEINIDMDTILPIGILINELVSNTIKHAEYFNSILTISIQAEMQNDRLRILYLDSGDIFKDRVNKESLGLFIIESMVQQLAGHYERQNSSYQFWLNIK